MRTRGTEAASPGIGKSKAGNGKAGNGEMRPFPSCPLKRKDLACGLGPYAKSFPKQPLKK